MKQKLFLFLFLILMITALVGLNAVSYVQKEKTPDSEMTPNRSTYNNGTTGTQALFSLLSETGRKVVRWQEPSAALITDKKNVPAVFVVIGSLRREFTASETEQLLRWVSNGGRLVLIDREPPSDLITTTANWQIKFTGGNPFQLLNVDSSDQKQMIGETAAIKPVQPTVYTHSINAVQPSRFAASIGFERFDDAESKKGQGNGSGSDTPPPPPPKRVPTPEEYDDGDRRTKILSGHQTLMESGPATSSTPLRADTRLADSNVASPSQSAPVALFAAGERNLLVEAPFGEGRIIFLADPYIVSNGGINLVDNAQLAINILSAGDRVIAFDEYHQGYGTNNNQFLKFFEGTPVVAIFLQGLLLVGLIFFSQSRRFGRAVPGSEPDRLSKLEYVSAMAELQERSRAYDLAIENIYVEFRRRASRLLGADNYTVGYNDLARLIAERTGLDAAGVADLMFKCEDIIRGEPTNKREVLELSGALRLLEERLGMKRAVKSGI